MKGKIVFKGHFAEYFVMSLGLLILTIITLGILLPYYVYWSLKYFFTRLEVELYTPPIGSVAPTNVTLTVPSQDQVPSQVKEIETQKSPKT